MRALVGAWALGLTGLVALSGCPDDPVATGDADVRADGDVAEVAADTDAETVQEVTPDTTPEPECRPFTLAGTLVAGSAAGTFSLGGSADLGLGTADKDALAFEFFDDQAGHFELGVGANANYASCTECMTGVMDLDPAGVRPAKHLFAMAGTLDIDASTPPQGRFMKATLAGVKLVEVTIRNGDSHSDPVKGAMCYVQTGTATLETAVCVPSCAGRTCGEDGCGGECGAGCGAGECTLDGTKCEATPTCQAVTVSGTVTRTATGVYRMKVTDKGLGALEVNDFLQFEFYTAGTGGFDLADAPDDNYATCNHCVRLVLDGQRDFFQASGTLTLGEGSDPLGTPPGGAVTITARTGIRLVEVAIEAPDYESIGIPGGACIDLAIDGALTKAP